MSDEGSEPVLIERQIRNAPARRQSPTTLRRVTGTDGSAIATGHLLRETINPAQSSGQSAADRTSKQSYNALGEVIRSTDPAGNRIDTTYSTAGRVVLRDVHTFASGFDTTVKSIETSYDGMGRLSRARSLSSTSATLNDEVFAYDGWGNLSQTTVDADSAYDASSGRPPMVTNMTWTRNTTASGWQRLRQATVEQPGGASARYKVDGDTISEAMGRISHIQENLTGSGAVLADYRYMGASAAVAAVLPEPNIGTRLYPISGGSADYDQFLDRFNRPIKNQWAKDYNQFNKPVFVEFLPAYDRGGFVTRVEDTKLGTGKRDDNPNLDFVRKFDQLVTRDALKRVVKQEEGQLVYSNTTPPIPTVDVMSRQQIFERDLRGRVTRNKVDLNGNNGFADGTLTSADGGEVDDEREYFRTSVLVMRYVSDSTPLSKEPLPPTYDRNGNLTSDAQKHVYVYNPWCQLVEVRAFGQTPTVVLARYTYTATGQRVTEQYDHDGDGEVTSSDVTTIISSDIAGRRVASFVNVGTFYAKETFFHHPPEIRGPGFAGGPLVRDRNDVLGSSPEKWNEGAAADRLERRYYATDWQGRVVSLVTAGGELAETYRYSATGVPFGIPLGDVNGDGRVDGSTGGEDWEQALYYEENGNGGVYDARVDLNLDGSNNSTDVGIVAGQNGVATGRAQLSSATQFNRIVSDGADWSESLRASMIDGTLSGVVHSTHQASNCDGRYVMPGVRGLPILPYPTGPRGTRAFDADCHRWAQNMCHRWQERFRHSQRCVNACVRVARRNCEIGEKEVDSFGLARLELAQCTQYARIGCDELSSMRTQCYQDAIKGSVCEDSCKKCFTFDWMNMAFECMLGCGVAFIEKLPIIAPIFPAATPIAVKCITLCIGGALFVQSLNCLVCSQCTQRFHRGCDDELRRYFPDHWIDCGFNPWSSRPLLPRKTPRYS